MGAAWHPASGLLPSRLGRCRRRPVVIKPRRPAQPQPSRTWRTVLVCTYTYVPAWRLASEATRYIRTYGAAGRASLFAYADMRMHGLCGRGCLGLDGLLPIEEGRLLRGEDEERKSRLVWPVAGRNRRF